MRILRRGDFTKLRRGGPMGLVLLLEATVWLGFARLAILTIPFRWTIRLFLLNPGENAAPEHACIARAERTFRTFRAAAARTPWDNTCLTQALAGSYVARARGIPATVFLGVTNNGANGNAATRVGFEAHAWLSCGGVILTGASGYERYKVIARFRTGGSQKPPGR